MSPRQSSNPGDVLLDAIIVGGGIAGLWLANLLTRRGYQVVVLEASGLGSAQTLASQGLIHGGLKYTLAGKLTRASEAIASMPDRWRACLRGDGEVDLSGLESLSDRFYLFADGGSLGRLTAFFASRTLRGRIQRLLPGQYPEGLAGFDGVVYGLNDFVLDTTALLERLRRNVDSRVYRHQLRPHEVVAATDGWRLELGSGVVLRASNLILCAGEGNEGLIRGLGLPGPAMQRRPLKQVLVRHPELKPLYAHCLTAIRRPEPRLTISSHADPEIPGRWLWYLGGQIATDGIARSDSEQIDVARRELERLVPWIDWHGVELSCFSVNRAEPANEGGRRPDEAFATAGDGVLVCWPTKLSLAPDLGDKVVNEIQPPAGAADPPVLPLPHAEVGRPPWLSS